MSENIIQPNTDLEPEDNRTFEEKFRSVIEKVKPYIKKLWGKRKKIIIVNTAVLIIALAYLLFLAKPYFNSTVTILPEYGSKSSSVLSQLSGLASIAGVKVGEAAPTEFYQVLISSETVMQNVIYHKYKTEMYDDSVNLIQYFGINESDDNPVIQKRKKYLALQKYLLENSITTDIEKMTKVLNITVTMPEAQLSADVANGLVKSLDLYIRTQRKSFATEQSFYLEKRTQQVKDSLAAAENNLKAFREQNRIVTQSPNLLLEQGRLMRNVEILQTVFIELTKQLELAKIDEIKDAPVLNVKEFAKNPIKKTGPKKANALMTIMFFSFILSSLYFVFSDDVKKYVGIVRGK